MSDSADPDCRTCPGCGRAFTCGAEAGWSRCWCDDLPPLARPPEAGKGCYCPECLRERLDEALSRD